MGDALTQVDVQAGTGNNLLLGVEFALDHYWVTGADAGGGAGFIYEFDGTGALLNTYGQAAACIGWGARDLAFDGTYLYYGCDDGLIHQVDPATGAPTGTTIPTPLTPPRALAFDPATNHFWAANWDSNIFEIDNTGTVVNSFAAVGLSTYGMAWDSWSPGGPYLWAWSQDGTSPDLVLASQINPATGALTGTNFSGIALPSTGGSNNAGGAAISVSIPGQVNRVCLVTLHQADTDTIVVYDLNHVIPVELSSFTIE